MALVHMKAFQHHTQFSLSLFIFLFHLLCAFACLAFNLLIFFFFFTIYLAFPQLFLTYFLPYIGFLSNLSLPPCSCPKAELCPWKRRCAVFTRKRCRNVDDPTVVRYEAICHNRETLCSAV